VFDVVHPRRTTEKAGKEWIESTKGRWPANVGLDETTAAKLGECSRYYYCAKASKRERGEFNDHPTVKPLRLCEWLAKLVLPPPRDTPRRLLVPFAGSGSEILGALAAGWDEVLGIELNPDYVAIAERRVATC
jgi:site-specific DNA-methyltransferase (adenine-specific)